MGLGLTLSCGYCEAGPASVRRDTCCVKAAVLIQTVALLSLLPPGELGQLKEVGVSGVGLVKVRTGLCPGPKMESPGLVKVETGYSPGPKWQKVLMSALASLPTTHASS